MCIPIFIAPCDKYFPQECLKLVVKYFHYFYSPQSLWQILQDTFTLIIIIIISMMMINQEVTNSSPVKTVLESLSHPGSRESQQVIMMLIKDDCDDRNDDKNTNKKNYKITKKYNKSIMTRKSLPSWEEGEPSSRL